MPKFPQKTVRSQLKNRTLRIECRLTNNGFCFRTGNKSFFLKYPEPVWRAYPYLHKKFLVDNLAYILSANIPFVSKVDKIIYKNTSQPFIKPYLDLSIYEQIPSAVNSYKDGTLNQIAVFSRAKFLFQNNRVKKPPAAWPKTAQKKALLPRKGARRGGLRVPNIWEAPRPRRTR